VQSEPIRPSSKQARAPVLLGLAVAIPLVLVIIGLCSRIARAGGIR